MIRLETRRLVDLTTEEFTRCRELTLGSRGLMEEEAVLARYNDNKSRPSRYTEVVLLYEDDTIRGWCLLQPVYGQSRWLAYFYVEPLHRKLGYGSLLFKRAAEYGRFKIAIKPDFSNRYFFERFQDSWIEQYEDA